jgi:outer membrane protein assembly factor BamB
MTMVEAFLYRLRPKAPRTTRRTARWIVVGAAMLGMAAPVAAISAARVGVRVRPEVVPPGSKVFISGEGFEPAEHVTLFVDRTAVARTATDASGSFDIETRIPRWAKPGPHSIRARGAEEMATAPILVRTDWPRFHFDGASTGFNPHENVLSQANVGHLHEAWTAETLGNVVSSAVVTGGVVYFGSEGLSGYDAYVHAVDAETGVSIWEVKTQGLAVETPATAAGIVYVPTLIDHRLHAYDARTGQELWNFEGYGATMAPAVVQGTVYFPAAGGVVYALDGTTGDRIWLARIGGPINGSLAVVDGAVYVGTGEGEVFALDASSGEVRWHYDTGLTAIASTPAVVDGSLYIGSNNGLVYALSAINGELLWTFETGGEVPSSPAVAYGMVYVGSIDRNVYALDAQRGTMVWRFETGDSISYASPAVARGVVYIGSKDGRIYGLGARNGSRLWMEALGGGINDTAAVADGMVYIAGLEPRLHAFGLDPSNADAH